MPLNKPNIGQSNWGPVLNDALDYLDSKEVSADTADFVFSEDNSEGSRSTMTITDHDMTIQTVRDEDSVGSDCDINIEAADDVFIRAYGDDIGIYASSEVEIRTNNYDGQGLGDGGNDSHSWTFNKNGHIEFPDGTVQTTSAQGIRPLPDFLTWREGTTHLPALNTNFGWNSDGVWFQNAQDEGAVSSYPIYTDFTVAQNEPVIVEFDFDANTECNDIGVCVYVDGTTPQWDWSPNTTRIAAQFDCFNLELVGRTTEVTVGEGEGIPGEGIYTVTFTYNPTASTDKVTVSYKAQGSSEVIASLSLNEALPAGRYRVGFAADQSSSNTKTYMSNLSIDVNNDDDFYSNDLQDGNSGFTSDTDLVIPVAIKDDNGDDFITFTRTSTGTARIATPQDDLSLRSARDITLFAGSEGPGNVYIGWGDAELTPDASNRVATIADVTAATGLGDITFDGVKITGAGTASGDGLGAGTMELVPDADLYANDQYLVIDPTDPNHIHIRAGGAMDESNAKVILGGERNHVYVSDGSRQVSIRTRPARIENTYANVNEASSTEFMAPMPIIVSVGYTVTVGETDYEVTAVTPNSPYEGMATVTATGASFVSGTSYTFSYEESYDNYWQFNSDGYLYGPAMGGLFVSGLLNGEGDLWLSSNDSVVLNGNEGGEFLGNPEFPGNQIAKLDDLAYLRTNVPTTSIGLPGEVAGLVADDANYHYYCTAAYDGTTHIWKRVAWDAGTWGD